MYTFSKNQKRNDCEDFQLKEFEHQNGSCDTDGHFLCNNCKHIVSFEEMDIADNRERYYPEQHKEDVKNWDALPF